MGKSFGSVLSFATLAQVPSVTTSTATSVTSSSATLNGSANPNGASTTGWFRHSVTNPGTCDDAFGTRAPLTGGSALGLGTSPVVYSQNATGLTASTTYYFCAIAENSAGKSYGSVLSFTTTDPPGWTWSGNGNTTYAGTATWAAVATIPSGSTKVALARYAMETDADLSGDRVNYSVTLSSLSCTNDGTPWTGSGLEYSCYVHADLNSNWTDSSGLTPDCGFRYVAASRTVEFQDTVTSEDCGIAVFRSSDALLAPSVTSVTGSNPQTTAGGKSITITGSNFVNVPTVTVGGTAATGVSFVSSTQLTATAPAKAVGSYDVIITNPDNQSGTCTGCMSYIAPPAVTTVSPSTDLLAAGGETVTVTGSGIKVGASGVKVDTTFATTSGTSSSATFTTPAHASGSVTLRVYGTSGTDANGIYTDYSPFTYAASAPTTTSTAATSVFNSSATINGSANPNGLSTTGWFRYNTVTGICSDWEINNLGTRVPSTGGTSLGLGTSAVAYSQSISSLTGSTTYYFCAIAENTLGKAYGSVLSFTTGETPWTWLNNGNTTYAGTSVWASIATVPSSATKIALSRYAMESPDADLSGDRGNYNVGFFNTTCTNNAGPWTGSPEFACTVITNLAADWTDTSALTPDCGFRYVAATRSIEFQDTVATEDCGIAAFAYPPSSTYTIQPDGVAGKDTYYGTSFTTGGCPDCADLSIGGWGDAYLDYLEFDLTGSPSDISTVKAEFWVYGSAPNNPTIEIRRITSAWTEVGVTKTSVPTEVAYTTIPAIPSSPAWIITDITTLYKGWKNGTYTNFGLKMHYTNTGAQNNGSVASSDNATAANRPKLVITYTP